MICSIITSCRAEGGSDEASNLITLCSGCYDKVYQRQRDGTYSHNRRTKAAQAGGKRLGNPKGPNAATRARGSAANAAGAREFAERLRPILFELENLSANAAARELARRGYATARGGKWTARSILNLRARIAG